MATRNLLLALWIATLAGATTLLPVPACTPAQAPLVEAGAKLVEDGCRIVEGIAETGLVDAVCATLDDLVHMAAFVLTSRAVPDVPAIVSEPGPLDAGAKCTPLPGGVCATPREIGHAIRFIRFRRALRELDAGAGKKDGAP